MFICIRVPTNEKTRILTQVMISMVPTVKIFLKAYFMVKIIKYVIMS